MTQRKVEAFASAWPILTEKQKNALLKQLDSFISQSTKSFEKQCLKKKNKPPILRQSASQVSNARQGKRSEVLQHASSIDRGFVNDTASSSYDESTGGAIHHSPPKIGTDGFPAYERSFISLRALETLEKQLATKKMLGKRRKRIL